MIAIRCYLPAVVLILSCTLAPAQETKESSSRNKTEDQLVAEAMLLALDVGSDDSTNATTAFRKAAAAYPKSAKVAYWRGRFGAYASNHAAVLEDVSNFLDDLAKPKAEDLEIADPVVKRKMQNMRGFAEIIGTQLHQRAKQASDSLAPEPFEQSLLEAVFRDPTLCIAWAGLLESSDTTIALAAADAWTEQEPDNALPLYAKAVVLSRNLRHGDNLPFPVAAIEALEAGNKRKQCQAPDEPWPSDFKLKFPEVVPEELAKHAGKPISPEKLRSMVESMFFQIEAIGGGNSLSTSELRHLGTRILNMSHRLSAEEDVRYLRAFAGVGVHLVQSNRFMYGLTAGSVHRILNRLETIAVDHGNYDQANDLAEIRGFVRRTRIRVGDLYRSSGSDTPQLELDRNATKVMNANERVISVPKIRFSDTKSRWTVVSDRASSRDGDYVFLTLFHSSDNFPFVCARDQRIPDPIPKSDKLEELGYETLDQAIAAVREENRKRKLRRGILLVASNAYMVTDIAGECFGSGYMGKRDPCIVAFTDSEHLESLRECDPYLEVRRAQVLGRGDPLNSELVDGISPQADLVVVPVERLMDPNGEVSAFIRSSKHRFIAITSEAAQRDIVSRVEGIESIVGVVIAKRAVELIK